MALIRFAAVTVHVETSFIWVQFGLFMAIVAAAQFHRFVQFGNKLGMTGGMGPIKTSSAQPN